MASSDLEKDPLGLFSEDVGSLPKPPPSQIEQKLIGLLTAKRDHAASQRKTRERSWEYNRLMLRGEQHIGHEPTTGDVVRMVFEQDSEQMVSTDNILLETARAYIGKFIRIVPSIVVLPATEDRADLRDAEVFDSFNQFQWRNLDLKLCYKRGLEYLPWAGTAILEPCWDHEKGRKIAFCPACSFGTDVETPGQPCPVCKLSAMQPDQFGMTPSDTELDAAAPKLQAIREGDVQLIVHDTRNFFPEPAVSEIEHMQWCYTRVPMPVNVLRRRFPDKAGLISAQDGITTERTLIMSLGNEFSSRYDAERLKFHAYHYRFHLAPMGNREFQWEGKTIDTSKGLIVEMVNDRVMDISESPYYEMFDQLPFVAMRADREPGVFWGIPPLDNSTSLQKERNTLATQTRENRELTNNPKMLVPDGGPYDVDRANTIPGEVIKYKSLQGKPSFLVPPALAQYTYAEFDRFARAIRGKFGVTENEVGNAPPDQSGRHSAFMEAQSNEAIAPIVLENMAAWGKAQYWVMLIGLRYYGNDRRWAIRGHDMPRSYNFGMANRLHLSAANVMLADEDSLSRNPALRLQQAIMLLDKGVYNTNTGVPDMKRFMRHAMLRMPGASQDDEAEQRAYAAQIPEKIRNGEPFQPKPWDDAAVCADELTIWLRGEGQNAPEPVVRKVAAIWSIYSVAALQQGQMVRAMPIQTGGPPGGGSVGAPGQLPGGPGPGEAPSVNAEASQIVQQSDAAAESAARPGGAREGATIQ